MASKSVLIVALLFSVLILCLQGTYAFIKIDAYRIRRDASASASSSSSSSASASASASASSSTSASGAIEGGFGNGNRDSQGYGDDEERTAAPRRRIWTISLREKFMQAIKHYGLENATPKRILEFMDEPDLTIKNVASHLQKYRNFLKKKEVAGDEDMRERLSRSSFARGHPELLFNNNERDQPHSQLPNQQLMEALFGSTFQVQPSAGIGSTPPLTAAASNRHGSIQFSNDQQFSTSNISRSIPPLIRSGQSSLLNNNPANFPRQQPTLGNRNGDQLFVQENRTAAFGMQQPSNNFENGEGGFGNGNWDSQGYGDDEERTAAPRKKRFVWKKSLGDKFMLAITHIGLDNATPKKILEFMNEPDLTIKNVASHLQKYRNYLKQLKIGVAGDEDMRERLRRSSFALGHLELFFNNNERDQHHSQLRKQHQMGTSIGSTFQPSAGIGSTLPLTAAASNSHGSIQFSNFENGGNLGLHDLPMMFRTDEQDNYQLPSQQQDGGHDQDQLLYQVEVPDPAANQVPNPSADQVPNPGPYHVEDNHETILEPGMPTVFESEDWNICLDTCQQQDGGHDQDQLLYQVEVPDPAANQVPNPSADQVPNPGPYHVEDNHETILEPGMPTVFESEDLNICLHTCQNIYEMLIRNWD